MNESNKPNESNDLRPIEILVNGKSLSLDNGTCISGLLKRLEVGQSAIAVEVNAEIATKDDFAATILVEGDVVEIVSLVGGG